MTISRSLPNRSVRVDVAKKDVGVAPHNVAATERPKRKKVDVTHDPPPLPSVAVNKVGTAQRADGEMPWWERAVFYQVYPRSFCDTDADGTGDLQGIINKLDHLKDLGINAVWITPFYPSPLVDFGYDISDYKDVSPEFGNLRTFKALVAEAHKRGIRIVMDMVLNHTSDQHPWFKESRSSRSSPFRDWYIWADPAKDGGPPNNWAGFEPSCWTLDESTGQYFYHYFYAQQPDLNWENPKVEAAMFDALKFWLDLGVDGFRLDAINWLFEDPARRDNPSAHQVPESDRFMVNFGQVPVHNINDPRTHEVLKRMRTLVESYGKERVLVGEVWVPRIQDLVPYYGKQNDELQLPFNFFLTKVGGLDAQEFRTTLDAMYSQLGEQWTTLVLSNHDLVRAVSRLAPPEHHDQVAKLLLCLLLTLRGTPFIYYGEEIGMAQNDPTSVDEVRDPMGIAQWPANKGRDGARTPMMWNAGTHAGFSTGKPWLKINADYPQRNVEAQAKDPGSVLAFFKDLTGLRSGCPALVSGSYESLDAPPGVLAYRRKVENEEVVVLINMNADAANCPLPTDRHQAWSLLKTTSPDASVFLDAHQARVGAFEAVVLRAPIKPLSPMGVRCSNIGTR